MVYVSFQILHATELEFLEDLNSAKDLDQIIAIHNSFVATIYERCLLHHKVSLLKEAIMKVLNITLTFQQWWDQGVASMKYVLPSFSSCSLHAYQKGRMFSKINSELIIIIFYLVTRFITARVRSTTGR